MKICDLMENLFKEASVPVLGGREGFYVEYSLKASEFTVGFRLFQAVGLPHYVSICMKSR